MFSNSTKYAIKAIIYIACNSSEEHKLLVRDIAQHTKIPKPYLSKIIQQLSINNYVSATKGRNGGIYISNFQLKTTLLEVITTTEGKDRFLECVLDFEQCHSKNPCSIHHFIANYKDNLRQKLKDITLEDLKVKNLIKISYLNQ